MRMFSGLMDSRRRGFTLIELLLVILIISVLAVTVFAAVNPAKRLQDTRNARRTSDVDTILSAIHSYIIDNKGSYPGTLASPTTIVQLGATGNTCTLAGNCTTAAACLDLSTPLATYLKSMPIDPTGGSTWTANKTGYAVAVDANGIVTVTACGTEGGGGVITESR